MNLRNGNEEESKGREPDLPGWVELVRSHIASLRFGVVQIVVHDSRVVQIEKTEKVRFDQRCSESSS